MSANTFYDADQVSPLDTETATPEQLIDALDDWDTHSEVYEALLSRGKASLDALIVGMKHPNGKIRAWCALLLDHLGDDRCTEPLMFALKHDPLEAVRRCALHSLACQVCKESPLDADVVAPIIEAALSDRSKQVRRRAVEYLSTHRPDPRVVDAMRHLLATESDAIIQKRARRTLSLHETPREETPLVCLRTTP